MTVARQFNSLLIGFVIIFAGLLLSVVLFGNAAPGILLGLVGGGTFYLVSHEETSLASRSVGFGSLLAGTALFMWLLHILGKTHPMLVPKVEISVAQFSICVICVILGPCLVFQGGARIAYRLAKRGAQNNDTLEL